MVNGRTLGLLDEVCWPDGTPASFRQDRLALMLYVTAMLLLNAATLLALLATLTSIGGWTWWLAGWAVGLTLDYSARRRLQRVVADTFGDAVPVVSYTVRLRLRWFEFGVRHCEQVVERYETQAKAQGDSRRFSKDYLCKAQKQRELGETLAARAEYLRSIVGPEHGESAPDRPVWYLSPRRTRGRG